MIFPSTRDLVQSPNCRSLLVLILITTFLCGSALGQTESPSLPPFTSTAIEEHINATTIVVARISNQSLMIPAIPQDMLSLSARDALSALNKNLVSIREALSSGETYLIIDIPFTQAQVPVRLLLEKPSASNEKNLTAILERSGMTILKERKFWIASPSGDLASSQRNAIQATTLSNIRPELETAFALVESYPIQIAVIPPAHIWRGYEEMMPILPPSLGGGPVKRITQGISWITVGCNPENLEFEATIQSTSAQAATDLADFLPTFLEKGNAFLSQTPLFNLQRLATVLLPCIQFTANDKQIKVSITGFKDAIADAQPASDMAVQNLLAFNDRQLKDQFRELLIGIHNYDSTFHVFPPAEKMRNKEGKSGLSWRVHILPYLDQNELYKKFKLDENWDSPHNIQLLEQMPAIYKTSAGGTLLQPREPLKAGYTTLVAPVGENTVFGGAKLVTFSHVTDGLSNTVILVNVEADKAVPWTAPMDFEFDASTPIEGISLTSDLKFMAAFGDGSVDYIPSNLPPQDLLHLFQMNDGNAVQW